MWERHTKKEVLEVLRAIDEKLEELSELLEGFLRRPRSAVLQIIVDNSNQGDLQMSATIKVGGAGAKAVYQEFDGPNGTGNKVNPVGTVAFSSDNPGVATVDSSGNITAIAAGTANITGNDTGANLPASDSVSVAAGGAGSPVSATLVVTAN